MQFLDVLKIKKENSNKLIISGLPPSSGGVGRVLEHLTHVEGGKPYLLIYRFSRPSLGKKFKSGKFVEFISACGQLFTHYFSSIFFQFRAFYLTISHRGAIVLVHPQTVGYVFSLCLVGISRKKAEIFLADNSFFCLKSFNYVHGEFNPCLRCLGGNFQNSKLYKCRSHPRKRKTLQARFFIRGIFYFSKRGWVRFVAQSENQQVLAERHFPPKTSVRSVGLWTSDIDRLVYEEYEQGKLSALAASYQSKASFDVCYHGDFNESKGIFWFLEVARSLSHRRFVIPVRSRRAVSQLGLNIPTNCEIVTASWGSGLMELLLDSRFVCLPSLWSAPIEGALVKSIVLGIPVCVVRNESAYSSTFPEGLVYSCRSSPVLGAEDLESGLTSLWKPNSRVLQVWINKYISDNKDFTRKLLYGSHMQSDS